MQTQRIEQRGGAPPARAAQTPPRADAQRVHAPRRGRDEDADADTRGWLFIFFFPRAARQTALFGARGLLLRRRSVGHAFGVDIVVVHLVVLESRRTKIALLSPAFHQRLGDDALELASLAGERRRLRAFRLETFRHVAKAPLELGGVRGVRREHMTRMGHGPRCLRQEARLKRRELGLGRRERVAEPINLGAPRGGGRRRRRRLGGLRGGSFPLSFPLLRRLLERVRLCLQLARARLARLRVRRAARRERLGLGDRGVKRVGVAVGGAGVALASSGLGLDRLQRVAFRLDLPLDARERLRRIRSLALAPGARLRGGRQRIVARRLRLGGVRFRRAQSAQKPREFHPLRRHQGVGVGSVPGSGVVVLALGLRGAPVAAFARIAPPQTEPRGERLDGRRGAHRPRIRLQHVLPSLVVHAGTPRRDHLRRERVHLVQRGRGGLEELHRPAARARRAPTREGAVTEARALRGVSSCRHLFAF